MAQVRKGAGRRPQAEGGAGGGGDSRGAGPVRSSHVIEEHVDVGVPREAAYDQWTRYQDLEQYSKKESAHARRTDRVSFTSKIGPSRRRWEAEVAEQVPGKRIAWRSVSGPRHLGVVTFHRLGDRLTRVMVQMEHHPSGMFETVGNFLRMQRRRVRKDLRLYKHFVEMRGEATGKGAGAVEGKGLTADADERLRSDETGETRRGSNRQAS